MNIFRKALREIQTPKWDHEEGWTFGGCLFLSIVGTAFCFIVAAVILAGMWGWHLVAGWVR